MTKKKDTTPFIDDWIPSDNEQIATINGNSIVIDYTGIFNFQKESINVYMMSKKRAYNTIAPHIAHYINYFIKYYDEHKEFIPHYLAIKVMTDMVKQPYPVTDFIHDIKLLFTPNILKGIEELVERNYIHDIGTSWNTSSSQLLKYENHHAKLLYRISMAVKFAIPALTHYMYARQITDANKFITDVIDAVFNVINPANTEVDMYTKLYHSVVSNIDQTKHSEKGSWGSQEIRGNDCENYADRLMNIVLTNTIPKYKFNDNIITLNNIVIRDQVKHFLNETYEFEFNSINNSTRDDDGLSDFDKFEIQNINEDESIILMNTINVKQVLAQIIRDHNKITPEEMEFYGEHVQLQKFQRDLLFQYFARRFGGTTYLFNINYNELIELIILMKRELTNQGFIIIQHILTGKAVRVNTRRIKQHYIDAQYRLIDTYPDFIFNNKVIDKHNLSTILTSQFELVHYEMKDKLGQTIDINRHKSIIVEEFIRFIALF